LPFPESLPEHDVAFIAVCEADENRDLLRQLSDLTPFWPRPLLNNPQCILDLSRDGAYTALKSLSGISMPLSVRSHRLTLEQIGRAELPTAAVLAGAEFPLIVRPVGSHAGRGLQKLDQPADAAAYLSRMPEQEFFLAPFVDYRSRDGLFRKYRIVLIDGRPFACHMAISEQWMVHYLNAGMSDNADKRNEEARWMATFDDDFARRHEAALRGINERMGLDYLGIDCAETRAGELLIFEVDSGAVVHAMDPVDTFPYKKPQMRKVFAAFREMLAKSAKSKNARH
jgi:glutathione synthase/RimK-type ligase-like ATP-grasp enzyme